MQEDTTIPPVPQFIRKAAARAGERARLAAFADIVEKHQKRVGVRITETVADMLRGAGREAEKELEALGHAVELGDISFAANVGHVYQRKDPRHYRAFIKCVEYMIQRSDMLLCSTAELVNQMLPSIEAALELDKPLSRQRFFYDDMTAPIKKEVRQLLAQQGYTLPRAHHKSLKAVRNFLRDNRPEGKETGNGVYQFFGGTHLRLTPGGRLLSIRDKRGIPCVRIKNVDRNIYALLGADGVSRETVDAWMQNSHGAVKAAPAVPESQWMLSPAEVERIGASEDRA